MPDGQTTGQRVEVRIAPTKRYTDDSYTTTNPDIVYRGEVVAWDLRGALALVQTERGRFLLCNITSLAILDSQEQREKKAAYEHAKDCGPLCREHGDPRDTNVLADASAFASQLIEENGEWLKDMAKR